jgi:hypothetical protein
LRRSFYRAGLGFIFLALVISYVPIIYQAFSRRELRISLLDSRAGSPPTAVELLRRNCVGNNVEELRMLLHDWEVRCADILESHLSYPILAFYCQHRPMCPIPINPRLGFKWSPSIFIAIPLFH